MRESLIKSIIHEQKTCYFISPHFDDAILSAGALITYLSTYTKIVVINIFTKAGEKPYTFSAKTYLKQCGYTDAEKLYRDRESEDSTVFKNIVDKVINLGFVDALWRKKSKTNIVTRLFGNIPELQVIYPTYRFHIIKGIIAKQDYETVRKIKQELQTILQHSDSVIFCPLGIGNHIDHIIAKQVCKDLYRNIIYWSDFPYNVVSGKQVPGLQSFSFDQNIIEKKKMIAGYVTQYAAMFKDGLVLKPEIFFTNTL